MSMLERRVQKVIAEQQAYQDWEKKWEGVEARLGGFPAKRHYWLMSGHDAIGTVVWERDWESLAACEAGNLKLLNDPEGQTLMAGANRLISSERLEFYYSF